MTQIAGRSFAWYAARSCSVILFATDDVFFDRVDDISGNSPRVERVGPVYRDLAQGRREVRILQELTDR